MPSKDKALVARYQKRWYEKNKARHQTNVKNRKDEMRKWYREFKNTLSCNRCSENHPACLQFHHTDPTQKEINVSVALKLGWNIERILSEVAKCEIVCANCHSKEHYVE